MKKFFMFLLVVLRLKNKKNKNCLDSYCAQNPWAAECRIYDV